MEDQLLIKSSAMKQHLVTPSPLRKKWFITAISLLSSLYLTYFLVNSLNSPIRVLEMSKNLLNYDGSPSESFSLSDSVQSSSNKTIILLWTAAFSSDTWWGATEKPLDCPCIVTRNRSYLSQARIVLFYWRNTNLKDLPRYKYQAQTWIWHHQESPMNTHRKSDLKMMSNYIDCWSSYRMDSDFPTPYGKIITKSPEEISKDNQTATVSFSTKTRNVAWMVSNCGAPSGRDEYVKELAKYIDIDIFGKCGSHKCMSSKGTKCYLNIESKYRFYLSFENSICSDYNTEKIFNVLNYQVLPIVFGGANYSAILPYHSYIDALSFKSPRYLALLLKKLAADEERYNSYFKWKSQYKVHNLDYREFLCDLCSKLQTTSNNHNDKRPLCNRRYKNIADWWFKNGSCSSWSPRNKS